MAFYKVTKTMKYTETVYVEADSEAEAQTKSGQEDGEVNHDDWWYDSDATEIEQDEYTEQTA